MMGAVIIPVGDDYVEVREWPTTADLEQYALSSPIHALLPSDPHTEPKLLYSIDVIGNGSDSRLFTASVQSDVSPARLVLVPIEFHHVLAVGLQNSIVGISTQQLSVRFVVHSDGIVNAAYYKWSSLLVVHEIGAMLVSMEGKVLWAVDTDLVNGWAVADESVNLESDSGSHTIRQDGSVVGHRRR